MEDNIVDQLSFALYEANIEKHLKAGSVASHIADAVAPFVEDLIRERENAKLAEMREPMVCGHPKACLGQVKCTDPDCGTDSEELGHTHIGCSVCAANNEFVDAIDNGSHKLLTELGVKLNSIGSESTCDGLHIRIGYLAKERDDAIAANAQREAKLRELVEKWRRGAGRSNIGPLHGVGMNQAMNWCADELLTLLQDATVEGEG